MNRTWSAAELHSEASSPQRACWSSCNNNNNNSNNQISIAPYASYRGAEVWREVWVPSSSAVCQYSFIAPLYQLLRSYRWDSHSLHCRRCFHYQILVSIILDFLQDNMHCMSNAWQPSQSNTHLFNDWLILLQTIITVFLVLTFIILLTFIIIFTIIIILISCIIFCRVNSNCSVNLMLSWKKHRF